MLFATGADPYGQRHRFQKRVRYLCGLLGHWVSFVRPRGDFSEYACVTCGHPFLFAQRRHMRAAA